MTDPGWAEQVAQVVMRGLAAGSAVEIDGLGVFYPDARHVFRFEPRRLPRVFLAYVVENRPRAIEGAIESADFFVACFSENSVRKKGGFQAEIRYALDCAREIPLDEIFIVPVRLDGCRVPRAIQREYQYVDLFPDWAKGMRRLLGMLRKETERHRARR